MRRRLHSARPVTEERRSLSERGDGPTRVRLGAGSGHVVTMDAPNMFMEDRNAHFFAGGGRKFLALRAFALDLPTDADAIVQRLNPQELADTSVSNPTLRRLRSNT